MKKNILSIHKPDNPLPLVFDSPHSGRTYPPDFDHACPRKDLERTEDRYVDELFAAAPAHGAPLLEAHFPRSYIDVNRTLEDMDPKLLAEEWPYWEINPGFRAEAGIGLIRRLIKPGAAVYRAPLPPAEIKRRVETCYRPYHEALETLIEEAHERFSQVWHINCHSMPSSGTFPNKATAGGKTRHADFCLGDRNGYSCDSGFTRAMRDFLKGLGYSVSINDPYKGVELVRRYSRPARGRHSLQVEINRALYMDEQTLEKNGNYAALKADIEKLIAFCADYARAALTPQAAD